MRAKSKLVAAMIIFGSIGLWVRKINMPSSLLALARGIIGTLFLLFAGLLMKRKISVPAIKKNFWLLLLSGAAIGANWICLFEAYRYTSISIATLCYYLAPVFVMMLSPVLLKERLTGMKAVSILVSLLGMVLVADVFNGTSDSVHNLKGIIFGMIAAVLYAFVVILNKSLREIEDVDMTVSQLGIAAVVLFPYVMLTKEVSFISLDGGTIFWILFVGIINTGAAYLLYFSSLKDLSGQTAALISYIDPVTAILLSVLLLGESMNITQTAGAFLILGATLFGELRREKG